MKIGHPRVIGALFLFLSLAPTCSSGMFNAGSPLVHEVVKKTVRFSVKHSGRLCVGTVGVGAAGLAYIYADEIKKGVNLGALTMLTYALEKPDGLGKPCYKFIPYFLASDADEEKLIPFLEQHPQSLAYLNNPRKFLNTYGSYFLQHCSNASTVLVQPVAKNMAYVSPMLVNELIKKNPQAIVPLAKGAAHVIERVDLLTVWPILNAKPEMASLFVYAATKNIKAVDSALLRKCILIDPTLARVLVERNASDIPKLSPSLIKTIVDAVPESTDYLKDPFLVHAHCLSYDVIEHVLEHHPAWAPLFAQELVNRGVICSPAKVKKIITLAPETATLFANSLVPVLEKVSPELLDVVALYPESRAVIRAALMHNATIDPLQETRPSFMEYGKTFGLVARELLGNYAVTTPTELHAAAHSFEIFDKNYVRSPQVADAFKRCSARAYQEALNNRVCVFHAQKSSWGLRAELFKHLWSIKYQQPVHDFQFLRFMSQRSPEQIKQESAVHKNIMQQGGSLENRSHLLFVNGALFGNLSNLGSSSASYFAQNDDMSVDNVSVDDLFKALDIPLALYEQYKNEIYALEKNFYEINNKHGNLLLIAMPKQRVNELMYLADSSGAKKSVMLNGESTHDVQKIMNALAKNPEVLSESDALEFCMPITAQPGGLLDPVDGPKIYSFNAASQVEYAAWQNEVTQLFKRMAKDYHSV